VHIWFPFAVNGLEGTPHPGSRQQPGFASSNDSMSHGAARISDLIDNPGAAVAIHESAAACASVAESTRTQIQARNHFNWLAGRPRPRCGRSGHIRGSEVPGLSCCSSSLARPMKVHNWCIVDFRQTIFVRDKWSTAGRLSPRRAARVATDLTGRERALCRHARRRIVGADEPVIVSSMTRLQASP
jgi:hypothetical protein